MSTYFSKEQIQMANRHTEKMLKLTSNKKNTNKNHTEVPMNPSEDGLHR